MYPAISGVGQVARDISNSLGIEDYEQKIICFNENAKTNEMETWKNKTQHTLLDGVEIIRCGVVCDMFSQSISFTYMRVLNRVIRDFAPDIVVFHYPNPFLAEFLTYYFKRSFKLIVYWHSDIIKQKYLAKFFRRQNHLLLKRAAVVVATSPNYIEGSEFLKQYKEKCVFIPNCVREDNLQPTENIIKKAAEIRGQNKDKLICFALGRHVKYKGFEYLIKASNLVDDRFCFYIGSDGVLTPQLKEMAKGDPKVHFPGRLSREDLNAYYYASDIFCFPSITKNEAFGIALVDAMYYGKPAITFTIKGSGVNYVNLDGVTGIECPNKNVESFAQALIRLADDKEMRKQYGQNASERVRQNFLYEQFAINIKKLFSQL